MSDRVITLCPMCAELFKDGFKLTKIIGKTTTDKKTACEECKKKYPSDILTQYIVKSKRR